MACDVAGSTALYRRHPLERLRRDMIAVGSHMVHQPRIFASIGASLLDQQMGPTWF
jgi:hypothetical protein